MARQRHVAFVFDLSLCDGSTRTAVQVGTPDRLIGADMVAELNASRPTLSASKAERKALMQARQLLVRAGELSVLRGWDLPPAERFERVEVREVTACRLVTGGTR